MWVPLKLYNTGLAQETRMMGLPDQTEIKFDGIFTISILMKIAFICRSYRENKSSLLFETHVNDT